MIAALPAWRYKDILQLPMPVVELAAEAANKRYDEQNAFYAGIHGIDLNKGKKKTRKNDKSETENIKKELLSIPGATVLRRPKKNKATGDG